MISQNSFVANGSICCVLQRIEEIMKRTRKSEVEPPSAAPGTPNTHTHTLISRFVPSLFTALFPVYCFVSVHFIWLHIFSTGPVMFCWFGIMWRVQIDHSCWSESAAEWLSSVSQATEQRPHLVNESNTRRLPQHFSEFSHPKCF